MRVLIAMPSLRRGGAERHSVYLATALTAAGHQVDVVALSDGPFSQDLSEAGIPVTVLEVGCGARALPTVTRRLSQVVDRLNPDVISAHDVNVEMALRGVLLRRWRPAIVWKHTYGHIGHRGARERLVEAASGHLVAAYGAVCHTQVRYLCQALGLPSRKIHVLPNTVPTAPEASWPVDEPLTVAMVAAMRADKGHDDALRAWSGVVRRHPEATLVLAGDGPARDEILGQISRLGLTRNVRVLGEVAEPLQVVARSHALLLASYNIECFPYVALEAMSVGRGVISTSVGGLPEMVDDRVTGMLAPPRHPDALRDAILQAVEGNGLRDLGAAGRERLVHCFPMAAWNARAVQLIETVAGATRGGGAE